MISFWSNHQNRFFVKLEKNCRKDINLPYYSKLEKFSVCRIDFFLQNDQNSEYYVAFFQEKMTLNFVQMVSREIVSKEQKMVILAKNQKLAVLYRTIKIIP